MWAITGNRQLRRINAVQGGAQIAAPREVMDAPATGRDVPQVISPAADPPPAAPESGSRNAPPRA